jgi:hypothetical protein
MTVHRTVGQRDQKDKVFSPLNITQVSTVNEKLVGFLETNMNQCICDQRE